MQTLLVNELETRRFIKTLFPILERDQVLLIQLFARDKYSIRKGELKSEGVLLKDIINTNSIEVIIRKIRRLSTTNDFYFDLKTGVPIPLHNFVLYINLIPKSMIKAFFLFQREILARIESLTLQPNLEIQLQEVNRFKAMRDSLYSAIAKVESNAYKPFVLIDIDKKSSKLLQEILEILNFNYKWISETHGGFHVLLDCSNLTAEEGAEIFPAIKELGKGLGPKIIEIQDQIITPIVGTLQGGFEVKEYVLKR